MKKELVMTFILIFAMSFVIAAQADVQSANKNQGATTNAQNLKNTSKEVICCKIYGLGAYMEEVNVEYKLMKRSECVVPEEFVGGGREIVEYKLCKKTLNQSQVGEIMRARNRLRIHTNQSECPSNCTCSGSTTKCQFQNGTRVMTIHAGKSGNIIVQVKNTNMSTNVTLYKAEDGKVYAVFKNNETREIILPDEVRERIQERLRQRNCTCENITLNEDGEYSVQARKRARLFWLIPVRERVQTRLDAETGEIIRIRTSWWGFLARDIKEDTSEGEE